MTNPLAGPIRHAVDDAHHSPPHMKNRDYKQLKCSITIIYHIAVLFHVSRPLFHSRDYYPSCQPFQLLSTNTYQIIHHFSDKNR
jgi:hypothetical protein